MGSRLSVPRGPAGTTEASHLTTRPSPAQANPFSRRFRLNSRTILAPAGLLLLSGLFFIYTRTTITAAKENARRHRAADGGSISWRNETLRRHGVLEKPEERTLLQEIFKTSKDDSGGKGGEEKRKEVYKEINPIEEGIRRARDRSARAGGYGSGVEKE